jgi:hypothetical protein
MRDEEWIKTLEDSRKARFLCPQLPEVGVFIPDELEGHQVVYSVVLTKARRAAVWENCRSV